MDGPSRARPGLVVAALTLLLVLATVLAAFLAIRYVRFDDGPSSLAADSETYVSDAERTEALQVAEQFALRMDAISGADAQGYVKRVKELLTTKGRTSFDEEWGALQKVGIDAQTQGKGEVHASALSDIDPDSATALVVHDAVVTTAQGASGRHYRWSVELERVGDKWLVDSFEQVT